jgi:hypothetical protein
MKSFKTLFFSLFVVSLSGCGGGSSSDTQVVETPPAATNTAPVAVQDNTTVTNNAIVTIDVLANDSDPESDSLTITEIVTQPNFGTASIVNNQIEFTPQSNFAGTDSITYRISDSELTADAEVTLALTQSLTLSGSVNNLNGVDAVISATIGDQSLPIQAEDDGQFSIDLTITDSTQFIQLAANNADQQPLLVSLLGNAEQLLEQSSQDRELTPNEAPLLNLSNISTAFYLLGEDLNGNQPIDIVESFNDIVSEINAQDTLNVAAFMQLIDNDNDFTLDENTTVLAFLDNDDLPTTDNVIQQYLADNNFLNFLDDPTAIYTDALENAISDLVLALPTNNTFERIIDTYLEQPILALPAQQSGFVAQQADTFTLNIDGTGTYYSSAASFSFLLTPSTVNWSIESDHLSIRFDSGFDGIVPILDDGSSPDIEAIEEIFGPEVAELFEQDPSLVFRSNMRFDEEVQEFSLLNSIDSTQAHVVNQTSFIGELELPDSAPLGPNIPFNFVFSTSANNLSNSIDNVLVGASETDIEGEWALPLVTEIVPFIAETDTPESRLIKEKFTLNSDGIAIGSFTGAEYNWSFENGVITLENQQESYEYRPFRLNGKEYQIVLTHFSEGQILRQQVSTIAQFDDSFTEFTDNITTQLPEIYNAHIASTSSESWIGDTLRASSIFGHQFNTDGTALSFIIAGPISSSFVAFFRNIAWTQSENRIILTAGAGSSSRIDERTWEVISVDDAGRVLVWEIRTDVRDDNNSGDLSDDLVRFAAAPRINILTLQDLSQYPEILERSDLIQGEQGNLNAENLEALSKLD